MKAKYNWIIDSPLVRIAINSIAFAAWFWVSFGLMMLAVKG